MWYVYHLYWRQVSLGIIVLFMHNFHKNVNPFVDFKVWRNDNVIKSIYWNKENYSTMCFVPSRPRRHAKIVMCTLNADWLRILTYLSWNILNPTDKELLMMTSWYANFFCITGEQLLNSATLCVSSYYQSQYYQPKMVEGIQGKAVCSVCFYHPCNVWKVKCVHLTVYSMSDLLASCVDQQNFFLGEIGCIIFGILIVTVVSEQAGWKKRLSFISINGLSW